MNLVYIYYLKASFSVCFLLFSSRDSFPLSFEFIFLKYKLPFASKNSNLAFDKICLELSSSVKKSKIISPFSPGATPKINGA